MESTLRSPKYRITPSLLNSFQSLIDSDISWEKYYGSQDEPSFTLTEYYDKCEKELLDACNRVPFVSEPASKGTALNEIIDCILDRRPQRNDMNVERIFGANGNVIGLQAELDGFTFQFDMGLVDELVDYFFEATAQFRCEATIDTAYGPVILYGDADYIRRDVVYDLKSTSHYDYGKFSNGWQKHVYPYALIESGQVTSISGFEYTVVPLTGGTSRSPLISGTIYREWYDYSHERTKEALKGIVEPFISWVEAHREQITHPRIFNK